MRIEQIGSLRVELYDGIDDMPMHLSVLTHEYEVLDYQIGSSMADVLGHFRRMDYYWNKKQYDVAGRVRKNMHQTFHNMLTGNNHKAFQYCCHVKSINGKDIEDYSIPSMKEMIQLLGRNGLKFGKAVSDTNAIKKKFTPSLRRLFQKMLRTVLPSITGKTSKAR